MGPHRRQPTRLPHPWNSPGKNTGVGCHFLLHICVYIYINLNIPIYLTTPSPPLVSIRLFSMSVSLFLLCKNVLLYYFSRCHIYVLIYDICFVWPVCSKCVFISWPCAGHGRYLGTGQPWFPALVELIVSLVGRKRWLHMHERLSGHGGKSCVLWDVTGGTDEPDHRWGGIKREGCVPQRWGACGQPCPGTERLELTAALWTCSSHGEVNGSYREPHQNSPRLLQSLLKHCFLVGVVGVGGGGPWLLKIATSITFPSCSSLPSLLYFSPYHE